MLLISLIMYFFLLNLIHLSQSPNIGEEIYTEKGMEKLEKLMDFRWSRGNFDVEKYSGKIKPAGNYFVILWEEFEENEILKNERTTNCNPRHRPFVLLSESGDEFTMNILTYLRKKDSGGYLERCFKQFFWMETDEKGEFEFVYKNLNGKKPEKMEIANLFEMNEKLKITILPDNQQNELKMTQLFFPAEQMLILKGFKNTLEQNNENFELIEFKENEKQHFDEGIHLFSSQSLPNLSIEHKFGEESPNSKFTKSLPELPDLIKENPKKEEERKLLKKEKEDTHIYSSQSQPNLSIEKEFEGGLSTKSKFRKSLSFTEKAKKKEEKAYPKKKQSPKTILYSSQSQPNLSIENEYDRGLSKSKFTKSLSFAEKAKYNGGKKSPKKKESPKTERISLDEWSSRLRINYNLS